MVCFDQEERRLNKLDKAIARILWDADPLGAQVRHQLESRLTFSVEKIEEKIDLSEWEYREEACTIASKLNETRTFIGINWIIIKAFEINAAIDLADSLRLHQAARQIWNLKRIRQGMPSEPIQEKDLQPPFPGVFVTSPAGMRDPAADCWLQMTIARLEEGIWSWKEQWYEINKYERLSKAVNGFISEHNIMCHSHDLSIENGYIAERIARALPLFGGYKEVAKFIVSQSAMAFRITKPNKNVLVPCNIAYFV